MKKIIIFAVIMMAIAFLPGCMPASVDVSNGNDVVVIDRQIHEEPDDRCYLEPDPGMCEAYIKRYYFDQDTNECKEFGWGGCSGVVPFETIDECRAACENNI